MRVYTATCYCGDSITTRFRWRATRFADRHGVDCSRPAWWLEQARGERVVIDLTERREARR